MTISVTRQHIDKGDQSSDRRCAIALAFAAAGFDASVDIRLVSFYKDGELLGTLPLPADAFFWNTRLDMGQKVNPFTFEMPGLPSDPHSAFPIPNSEFVSVPVT